MEFDMLDTKLHMRHGVSISVIQRCGLALSLAGYLLSGLVLQFLIIFAISGGAVSLVVIALLRGWATVLLSIVQRIWYRFASSSVGIA